MSKGPAKKIGPGPCLSPSKTIFRRILTKSPSNPDPPKETSLALVPYNPTQQSMARTAKAKLQDLTSGDMDLVREALKEEASCAPKGKKQNRIDVHCWTLPCKCMFEPSYVKTGAFHLKALGLHQRKTGAPLNCLLLCCCGCSTVLLASVALLEFCEEET